MLNRKYTVNNYTIEYNPYFNCWNVTKDGDVFGSYKKFINAYNEAKNG